MVNPNKTNPTLIKELKELQQKHHSLKIAFDEDAITQLQAKQKLILANKELAFQNKEKEKRAAELIIANKELAYQNDQKEKRAAELIIANKELIFQNKEKEKRAAELIIANKELAYQNKEKEKRAAELVIANKELAFQNDQKEKRAEELIIANKELAYQNDQKEKRAEELIVANKELAFQNEEKEKRAAELIIANKELAFQNKEKEKRAAELAIANKKLALLNRQIEKRSKIALEENENRFRAYVEQAADALFVHDFSGKFMDVNQRACETLGYSKAELLEMSVFDVEVDFDLEKAQEAWSQIEFNQHVTLLGHQRRKDGSIFPVEVSFGSFNMNDKRYFLGQVRDITERQKAQEKLQKNEQLLRLFVEHSPAAIAMFDKDMRYLVVSDHYKLAYKLDKQPVLGRSHYEVFPEITDEWKAIHKRCLAGEIIKKEEDCFLRLDGKLDWLKWEIHPWYEKEGEIGGIILFSEVITERRQAEEKLKENYALLNIAGDIAKLGGWNVNLEENRCYWSDEVAAIHEMPAGYAPLVEEGISFYAPEWRDKITEVFTNCAQKGIFYDEDMEVLTSSGKRLWVRTIGEAVRDNNGKIVKVQGAFQDITERRQAEEKLKENYALLHIAGEVAKLGGWKVNLEENRSYWSDEVAAIHEMPAGYAPLVEEAISFYAPEWRDKITEVFKNCARKGISFDEDMEILTASGKRIWVRTLGEAIRDPNGKIVKVHGAFQDITERKQIEEELKQSEEKFKNAVMSAPFPIMIHSENGDVILINDTWQDKTGYLHQEISTIEKWTQLAYGEKMSVVKEEINLLYEINKRKEEGEYEITTKNSGKIIWAFSSAPIGQNSDNQRLVISMALDITKRKQAEEELRKSEYLLRESQRIANIGGWSWPFFGPINWTDETYHVYGVSPETFIPTLESLANLIHPEDRQLMQHWIEDCVDGKSIGELVFRTILPDGSIRILKGYGELIYDSVKKPMLMSGTVQDITERKLAEEDLKKSEAEFRTLAESMPQIVWITNADGWNIYFNQQWSDYTGLTLEESYGHGWNSPFHPDDQKRAWDAWQNAINNNDIYSIEARLRRFDGVYMWWLVRGVPVFNKKGEIVKWYGTCTDIDSFKQISEEIKKLNETLEQRVLERTAQLDVTNKELQSFTYSVSHDLKAPLRGIDGYSNLLQELYAADLNEEAQNFIQSIRKGTAQMNLLIEDLLDYSRLERATYQKEKINIKTLLDKIKIQFESEISSTKWTFNIDVPDIEIITDSKGLSIALRNLIDNAFKFSKKSENPIVEISLKNEPAFWVIKLKDNGIGFEMKYKERIFEIFQQLNLPEEFPGTGIGLAMVHKSMEKMGGKVWAESIVGKGSTFCLEIPKQ